MLSRNEQWPPFKQCCPQHFNKVNSYEECSFYSYEECIIREMSQNITIKQECKYILL